MAEPLIYMNVSGVMTGYNLTELQSMVSKIIKGVLDMMRLIRTKDMLGVWNNLTIKISWPTNYLHS